MFLRLFYFEMDRAISTNYELVQNFVSRTYVQNLFKLDSRVWWLPRSHKKMNVFLVIPNEWGQNRMICMNQYLVEAAASGRVREVAVPLALRTHKLGLVLLVIRSLLTVHWKHTNTLVISNNNIGLGLFRKILTSCNISMISAAWCLILVYRLSVVVLRPLPSPN